MVYTIVCHLAAKPEHVDDLKAELANASKIYSKDKETIAFHVMQHAEDPTLFTLVERYEQESSQKYHLENPYWAEFKDKAGPWIASFELIKCHEFGQ
ncbi:hypothetical protein JCM6882_007631 [Rhodosporidiobolus microsporus]